jgi:formylmethanofuran dehydrogenase subunit B
MLRGGHPADAQCGVSSDVLEQLIERLTSCRSGIVYFGLGLAQAKMGYATVEALLRLVADLNAHTRFYARRMRIPGDVTGADTVLCWQTGFPFAVNLARGFPRYNPGEYTANDILERNEADACLLVGSEGVKELSKAALAQLNRIPTVVLDYPNVRPSLVPNVRFTTAIYGVHTRGTVYRMDEVPIPLREILPANYATDDEVLNLFSNAIDEHRASQISRHQSCKPPQTLNQN